MFTTMGTIGFCLCFILFALVNLVTGQSLPQEELLDVTTCTLNSVNLNCDNVDMIAFQSVHFYYHASCECCQYSSDHNTVGASQEDLTSIRRECSGKSSCTLNIEGVRTFDSGGKRPSYAVLYYYCIPKSRTTSICSADSLSSGGSFLYLTNEGFPSTTTDHRSCSCSLEVYSCASGFNMYLVDADMYLDEINCQQRIDIYDGKNASLLEIKCDSYYTNEIVTSTFKTNYIRFDFTDNAASNQEGIFFVGFGTTEANVAFKLSCAAEPQATCIVLDCGDPDSIPNGKITLDSGTRSFGSQATVSCSDGYETDNATLICLETGQWTNSTCSPKDCGELYTIPNGNLTAAVDGSTSFGTKANVACDPGYQVSGYCNRSTEFQCGDGTCINKIMRCDAFPDCRNELDELLCQNVISCPKGQKLCDVTCVNEQETCEDSESSVAGMEAGTISCLVTEKWEKVKCLAKDCGTPTEIENGIITLTEAGKTTYMSAANVTCDTGFTPSIALISCQADGSWENGTCNIIDCGMLAITNGQFNAPSGTTFRLTATQSCDNGYTFSGEETVICTDTGWNASAATCTIVDCGMLAITNGEFNAPSGTTFGLTATQSCNTGYTFSGEETVICTDTGWNASAVTCTIVDCGKLNVTSGQFNAPSGTTFGLTATQTCDNGYTFSGDKTVICTETGWNASAATCTIVDCGMPPTISNGNFTLDGLTTYLSTAKISCDSVYHMTRGSIICKEDGTWTIAFCVLTDCGEPHEIENGVIMFEIEDNTTFVSKAIVECDTGFTPSDEIILCIENGTWETSFCQINDCGEPYAILHGTITTLVTGNTSFGAKAHVACDPGYQVKNGETSETETGDGTISCLVIGKWEKVQCSAKDTAQKETSESSTLPVIILACSLTAVVSIALTLIVLFIVRKYKRAKPNTLTSPPEHVVYYNTGVRENLENSEGDYHPYEHLNETNASEATYSTLDVHVSTNQRTSIDCL